MTNLQLWLGIGIPSLLVVLSWIQSNSRLSDLKESINLRFAQLDQRFAQIDQRFTLIDQPLNRLDQRLDQIEAKMGRLEADYKDFYGMEKKLEGRVDELSRR